MLGLHLAYVASVGVQGTGDAHSVPMEGLRLLLCCSVKHNRVSLCCADWLETHYVGASAGLTGKCFLDLTEPRIHQLNYAG